MLSITGPDNNSEYSAAIDLREKIIREWPSLKDDSMQNLHIFSSVKCYGQPIQDIDLVVLCKLREPIEFSSSNQNKVFFQSLCLTIEVKRTSVEGVRFIGNQVEVIYHRKWHNVSDQSFNQVHSLRKYLIKHNIHPPYIRNLIWLLNVPKNQLPNNLNNIVGQDHTWGDILGKLLDLKGIDKLWKKKDGTLEFSDIGSMTSVEPIVKLLGERIVPSSLDRLKMEKIAKRLLSDQKYSKLFGQQLLVFRGRGGTGKTAKLLQLAQDLYTDEDARVLILTYNKALVADLRRLLTLMGNSDGVARKSISVQTVHKYLRDFLICLGIIKDSKDSGDFLEKYSYYKNEAIKYIESELVTKSDIEKLIKNRNSVFTWDYIFIDESQDWPIDERDLLYRVYTHKMFVLADGVDQLVRSNISIDWKEELNKDEYQIVPLRQSIRLKTVICQFTNVFSKKMGLIDWNIDPNTDMYGGKIIVIEGKYGADRSIHEGLIEYVYDSKNYPVDMLFCVPPRLVETLPDNKRYSTVAKEFRKWGHQVWDGASEDVRTSFPRTLDELRIVQYDSCRGLEGWVVVNFELDNFFEYKLKTYEPTENEKEDIFFNRTESARLFALHWLMIPLTRAIDTLVIQVSKPSSPVTTALRECYQELGEAIEWIKV